MKRLLAYLFIVFGLGLTFSVNINASHEVGIKCFNPATEKIETWVSYDTCPGNRTIVKSSKKGWNIYRGSTIISNTINAFKKNISM